ncbi:calcium-activated chloride channel regulator 4-like [Latimeria chalumnae]|uniref:calcium-activated chloride channel regulator 4-like n=1 Tax=Latimeria chalumnae TaxID=7897 RepID=UPI00313CB6B0
MVTDASPYLFRATRNRAFFRDVKILLPKNWASNPELYKKAEREIFATAHVQIDVPSPTDHVKDNPYVLTKAQCGEQGNFIHFTPDYLLKEEISSPHGPKVFGTIVGDSGTKLSQATVSQALNYDPRLWIVKQWEYME